MSTLQFWLSYNNGAERLRLPINPEKITVTSSHGYEDIEVTGLGEFTVIGNDKLREYSFSSFFPRDYNPSYCEYEDFPQPWDCVATIERWMATKRPIRLTITGTPINTPVTIRNFTYFEEGGHVGDLYFEITLKEYVFVEFERYVELSASGSSVTMAPEDVRSNSREVPSSYTVKSGDSLWLIAQRTYGNGDKWRQIYDANKATIGANPNLIKVGQTLVIPS